jgi:hypothetical protein
MFSFLSCSGDEIAMQIVRDIVLVTENATLENFCKVSVYETRKSKQCDALVDPTFVTT